MTNPERQDVLRGEFLGEDGGSIRVRQGSGRCRGRSTAHDDEDELIK